MKLFKLLIISVIVVHVAILTTVVAITVQQPPQVISDQSPACSAPAPLPAELSGQPSVTVPPPQRPTLGPGTLALLVAHLVMFVSVGTWLISRVMADYDRAWPAAAEPARALAYLQEQTRGAGEFVVISHAEEDLQPLRPGELDAALIQARAQDPDLEHKVVAGRWILRRPRI